MGIYDFLAKRAGIHSSSDTTDNLHREIYVLNHLLTEAGIPHEFAPIFSPFGFVTNPCMGYRLTYYGKKGKLVSQDANSVSTDDGAVCTVYSMESVPGHEKGKIGLRGMLTDEERISCGNSILGNLTAEDVFKRIKAHWESKP